MADRRKEMAKKVALATEKKLGHRGASTGAIDYQLNVVPTGILSLDYALGTGGWPLGFSAEVFGPPDIGKSSFIGLSAIREAQKVGKLPGLICLEPGFDPVWAAKHGVDPEMLAVAWPNDGQEAFEVLYDWTVSGAVDFIVFDSIGALLNPSEAGEDGVQKAYGQSGLITWGVKRVTPALWKNDVGVIYLNQVRADTGARYASALDSPGGWALRHLCPIRVQLKPGKDRFFHKIDGDDVLIGRSINAVIKRNKMTEGSDQKAIFNAYQKEVIGEPFGIDLADDVMNTAIRTGVFTYKGDSNSILEHKTFPGGKINGKKNIVKFLVEKPEAVQAIRDEVMAVMRERVQQPSEKPQLEAVEGE
jgi:recombination protein RecA